MIERLNELFVCDFLAGTLHWRVSRGRSKAGDRAGGIRPDGYRHVQVDGRLLLEHRIIVSMIEGRTLDADEEVDHENGVRDDNRIENLRIVTASENQRNQRVHRASRSACTWTGRGGSGGRRSGSTAGSATSSSTPTSPSQPARSISSTRC